MAQGTPQQYQGSFVVGEEFKPYKHFHGIFIPDPIAEYDGLSMGAKFAYGRLMRYAGEDGNAFPAVGTLAAKMCVSINQARRYLQELIAERLVRVLTCDGRTNQYKFLWHEVFDGVPLTSVPPLPLPSVGGVYAEKKGLPLSPVVALPLPSVGGVYAGKKGIPLPPGGGRPPPPGGGAEREMKRSKNFGGQTREDSYAREQFRLMVLDATGAGSISPQLANRMYTFAVESRVPMELIQQYMYDLCKEKRDLGDPIGPPVLAQALKEKRYIPWLKKTENRNLLERCLRQREEREYLESLRKPATQEQRPDEVKTKGASA